jgi:hypothetical protein
MTPPGDVLSADLPSRSSFYSPAGRSVQCDLLLGTNDAAITLTDVYTGSTPTDLRDAAQVA